MELRLRLRRFRLERGSKSVHQAGSGILFEVESVKCSCICKTVFFVAFLGYQ